MPDPASPQVIDVKLVPPRARPDTIRRDRVRRLLDDAVTAHVTLVCAPAGYGKTTALADWCAELHAQTAWISLGHEDNDARRLCAHLLAALDQLWPAAIWPAQQALRGGSDLVETVAPLIAGAVTREVTRGGLVVVLDDCQAIVAEPCQRFLMALIDHLPASARIVLASRTRPRLRLARARAAGMIAEIGPADLAFRDEETEGLLNGALRLRLARDQVEAIQARVEGWPAGLSLVAARLQHDRDADSVATALSGSREHIAEYLMEEVLDALAPELRDFLARTSILGRMNASLCEAVLGHPDAAAMLDEVRRTNLFLATHQTGDEDWVRYHGLFAELLQRDLRHRTQEEIAVLHRRASLWFRDAGLPEEAIDHAIAADDGALAAEILHESWWQLIGERRYATVRGMIERMPADRGQLGPFCDVVDIYCTSLQGADLRLVAERLDALEAHRDAPSVAPTLDALLISPYYGDIPRALAIGRRVWDDAAGDPPRRHAQAGKLATVLWFAGERGAVHTEIGAYFGHTDRHVLRSWELAALALCAADDGELEAAERHGRGAVAAVEDNGSESALEAHLAYVALADVLRRRSSLDEAYVRIASALRITARLPASLYHAFALVVGAQVDLATRDRRHARQRAEAARLIVDRHRDTGVLGDRLAQVEAALARPGHHAASHSEPTDAERRVLALLPTPLSRREIAAELQLSVATVKSHTWRLYRRLGTTTRAGAVAIARERGLL